MRIVSVSVSRSGGNVRHFGDGGYWGGSCFSCVDSRLSALGVRRGNLVYLAVFRSDWVGIIC